MERSVKETVARLTDASADSSEQSNHVLGAKTEHHNWVCSFYGLHKVSLESNKTSSWFPFLSLSFCFFLCCFVGCVFVCFFWGGYFLFVCSASSLQTLPSFLRWILNRVSSDGASEFKCHFQSSRALCSTKTACVCPSVVMGPVSQVNANRAYPRAVGDADAEIKVPSSENVELKRSPFKAWSRSVYSHACYAYCQEFLPCLILPFLM